MPVPALPRSGNNTEKKDPRLELADRLIEQIEAGTASWQRPWQAGAVLAPVNAVTGKRYNGVNYQNLMTFSPDPSDPRWCTYKQAQEQGWQVRKGEHGIPIEKWSRYEHKRTEEEMGRLRVALESSEPSERRHLAQVNVRVFERGTNEHGAPALNQIHEYPGRLRANEALRKLPDHREGKAIEQALGVDPKMLNPAREAYKSPARSQDKQKQQGVEI